MVHGTIGEVRLVGKEVALRNLVTQQCEVDLDISLCVGDRSSNQSL